MSIQNIAFIDGKTDRAIEAIGYFADYTAAKNYRFYYLYPSENFQLFDTETKNLQDIENEQIPTEFDIIFVHKSDSESAENIRAKHYISYSGGGYKPTYSSENAHQQLFIFPLTDEVKDAINPKVVESILSYCAGNKAFSPYLFPGGNDLKEEKLRQTYQLFGKVAEGYAPISTPNLSTKVAILWNKCTFENNDYSGNRAMFLRQRVLNYLKEYGVGEHILNEEPSFEANIFVENVLKQKPENALICAEIEGKSEWLIFLEGVEIAAELRLKGYKGSIFIATQLSPSEWENQKSTKLAAYRHFLQTPFTYTVFLQSLLPTFDANTRQYCLANLPEKLLSEAEILEIQERKQQKMAFMNEDLLRNICEYSLQPKGIVRTILHDIGTFATENRTEELENIFTKIAPFISFYAQNQWIRLKQEIIQNAKERQNENLTTIFNRWKQDILALITEKEETETLDLENEHLCVLYVDDDVDLCEKVKAHFEAQNVFCYTCHSVSEAISLMQKDKAGKLTRENGKMNQIRTIIADWHFYRMEKNATHRWAIQQGHDLINAIHELTLLVDIFVLTRMKSEILYQAQNRKHRVRWFSKEEKLEFLIYEVIKTAKNWYASLLPNWNGWVNVSPRNKYPLSYYYYLHRNQEDYANVEILANQRILEIYDKCHIWANRGDTISIEDLGGAENLIAFKRNHLNINPLKNLDIMRDKLMARKLVLALVTFMDYGEICAVLFDMDLRSEEYIKEAFGTYLGLPSDTADLRACIQSKTALLPEELQFLEEYVCG
jgi:hypothetical protein